MHNKHASKTFKCLHLFIIKYLLDNISADSTRTGTNFFWMRHQIINKPFQSIPHKLKKIKIIIINSLLLVT